HKVQATDGTHIHSAIFTVAAGSTISLNTNTANVGTGVRITGTNFSPSSQITLTYDGYTFVQNSSNDAPTPSNVQTDSNGGFAAIIAIQHSVTGTHTISVQDSANTKATKSITVTPYVFIYPSSGHAGSQVLIPDSQGNGFAANSPITITFDGSIVRTSTTIPTDSTGNFGGSFTVPSNASLGTHHIQISDGNGNTYSTSFTVTDSSTPTYNIQNIATGLNLPDSLAFIPDNGPGVDGSGAFMVNEKNTGNVIVFLNTNGQFSRQTKPFVTVPNLQTGFEDNGLLGIAFDPNWKNSKLVYFYVTRTVSGSVVGEVIRYHATTDSSGNIIADQSVGEKIVLGNIPNFQSGHNGGCLKFDSAGNLYITVSDGWGFVTAQDLKTLQGKMLRITPLASPDASGKLYSIPSGNPFASSTDPSIKKEIWGTGIRNAFTFDIDSQTGRIYASDVGYNAWERIDDFTAAGANAGWPNYEAPPFGNPQNLASYTPQTYWYPHEGVESQTSPEGLQAITGGAFYHGTYYPNLQGAYFFGDYGVHMISALLPSTAQPQIDPASGVPKGQVVPIYYGQDASPVYMAVWNGGLYFIDLTGNVNVLNYRSPSFSTATKCTTCKLTVTSQWTTGESLTGMYSTLRNSTRGLVSSGFTPVTFTLKNGTQYSIAMSNFKNIGFDHWLDTGSTSKQRPISIATDTQITAVYRDTALVLSPSSGPAGTTVTATGTTFSPNHTITITYDGAAVATTPTTIISNSTGGFSATFKVPLGSVGPHKVTATDGTNTHSAVFNDTPG
ncbi:MAG: hypothetical protein E6L00_06330, partial [Thaumarchaeota archaeon]